jgi:hypothetical protein
MSIMKNSSAVKPKGHVRISRPGEPRTVPSVLYRRQGRLFVPSRSSQFAREARPEEVLRGQEVLSDGPNHVTKAGRVRVAELIVGISADFPRRLGVGDGGTSPGTNVPLPPSDAAVDLVHEITRIDVSQRVIDVDVPSVTFVGLFQSAGSYQFNQPGQAVISEVGLFTTDDTLCAVYNFAPIPVDVHRLGVLIEWEWAIL